MNIFGIGTDVVPVDRLAKIARASETTMQERLFTESETRSLNQISLSSRRHQAYATSFAVKESVYKALGTGLIEGMSWRDVQVEDIFGDCRLTTFGRTAEMFAEFKIAESRISCSCTSQIAIAFVMLLTKELIHDQ